MPAKSASAAARAAAAASRRWCRAAAAVIPGWCLWGRGRVRVNTRTTNRIASNTPVMHSSAPRHSSCGGVFATAAFPVSLQNHAQLSQTAEATVSS
jgi:hypothetical protein